MNALMTTSSMTPMTGCLDPAHQIWKLCSAEQFFVHRWRVLLCCLLMSVCLHGFFGWVMDFRPMEPVIRERLLLVNLVGPPAVLAPVAASVPKELPGIQPPLPSAPPVQRKSSSAKIAPKKAVPPVPAPVRTPAQIPAIAEERNASVSKPEESPGVDAPIGHVAALPGVTVLANESGQDTLKHGAEARFMHGVATEEFVEENYVGEYSLGAAGRVCIEDDRARSGHLILHAEGMGLTRKLFRFNRFIYVYGEDSESSEPILGSVTFFSDGYHIHQFLWQHNSTHAYFPRRN